METIDIKYVTEDEKSGIQLSPDIYVYQGKGTTKVGLGLFRLDTLGIRVKIEREFYIRDS